MGFLLGYAKLQMLSGKVDIFHHFILYHPYQVVLVPFPPFQIHKAMCQDYFIATLEDSSFDFLVV
jgi:hypothetical protein